LSLLVGRVKVVGQSSSLERMISYMHRECKCGCGVGFDTNDLRKVYLNKKHADRARNRVEDPAPVTPIGKLYQGKKASDVGTYDSVNELRFFSKLNDDGKESVLLGEGGFSVGMYDIEATHLKPNVGRILCCSFKPIGGKVTTFDAHQRAYMKPDVYDDGDLAIAIRDELEKYDIIVGWNSKNFDTKFINSRAARAGGRTKAAQYHVDGMWSWRSKHLAWSGLNNVQRFLLPGNEAEKTSIEWDKWMQALGWNKALRTSAMAEIVEHCELDVTVLEDVYRAMIQQRVIRSLRKDGGVL
jgi:uncharacterized protein YprB with RNaseH-like and TPR domain